MPLVQLYRPTIDYNDVEINKPIAIHRGFSLPNLSEVWVLMNQQACGFKTGHRNQATAASSACFISASFAAASPSLVAASISMASAFSSSGRFLFSRDGVGMGPLPKPEHIFVKRPLDFLSSSF